MNNSFEEPFEKLPITWWQWLIASIIIFLVGVFVLYISHFILGAVIIAAVFSWLSYKYLKFHSYRCKKCGRRGIGLVPIGLELHWVCGGCGAMKIAQGAGWA